MEELLKKIQAEAQRGVGERLRQFMTENPEVTSVQWFQTTPEYNDGDACEFSVSPPEVYVGPVGGDNDYQNRYDLDRAGRGVLADSLEKLGKEFYPAKNLFLLAFGNNKKVTVAKDQINIEECDSGY